MGIRGVHTPGFIMPPRSRLENVGTRVVAIAMYRNTSTMSKALELDESSLIFHQTSPTEHAGRDASRALHPDRDRTAARRTRDMGRTGTLSRPGSRHTRDRRQVHIGVTTSDRRRYPAADAAAS
jgi:hypothetical protein